MNWSKMLNRELSKKLTKGQEALEDLKRKKIQELNEYLRLKKEQEQIKNQDELDKIEREYHALNNQTTQALRARMDKIE